MKPFHFQQFSIQQSNEVFKVGTDTVLLGALAKIKNTKSILEVGTGTGMIALMLAQRNASTQITAIDINPKAVVLATENVAKSPFATQISVEELDLKKFQPKEKFDSIVSNPPYFTVNDMQHKTYSQARMQLDLPIEILFQFSSKHLSKAGTLQLIFPYSELENLQTLGRKYSFSLTEVIRIKGMKQNDFKRVFCVFQHTASLPKTIEKDLIIEEQRGVFTQEYQELTKDFHLINSNKKI